jgi:hypothetical protein
MSATLAAVDAATATPIATPVYILDFFCPSVKGGYCEGVLAGCGDTEGVGLGEGEGDEADPGLPLQRFPDKRFLKGFPSVAKGFFPLSLLGACV